MNKKLLKIYNRLYDAFGPQGWWPGDTPFEVAVGAILTQNTNWQNVERAIKNLRDARCLSPMTIFKISHNELAELIRPSGYFNVKALRLKNFVDFLVHQYRGSLMNMQHEDADVLRAKLLQVKGIGKETADSILLYALNKRVFVIDAYTKRILSRHGIISEDASYDECQELFHSHLSRDLQLYNEYHALIVRVGKEFCRKRPKCKDCPLGRDKGGAYE
jgi:endonuclease-3 related protein